MTFVIHARRLSTYTLDYQSAERMAYENDGLINSPFQFAVSVELRYESLGMVMYMILGWFNAGE